MSNYMVACIIPTPRPTSEKRVGRLTTIAPPSGGALHLPKTTTLMWLFFMSHELRRVQGSFTMLFMTTGVAMNLTWFMAGARGIEPLSVVLETTILPLNHTPVATPI